MSGAHTSSHLGFLLAIAALIAIGLFFVLYLGLGGLRRIAQWEARAIRTRATVIRHEARTHKANTWHYPVVRYTPRTGNDAEAQLELPSRSPDPPVGGSIEVLYDAAAPAAARLPGQDRAGAIIMAVVGGILLTVGVIMVVAVFGRGFSR